MENKRNGRILRGVGGKYEVLLSDSSESRRIFCPARGVFRHDGIKPLPGDLVVLTFGEGDDRGKREGGVDSGWSIADILERRNALIRPALANLDFMFVTFAPADPDPAFDTIDKLIAVCEHNNITPIIIVTKSDLDPNGAERMRDIYAACGYDAFCLSKNDADAVSDLREHIFATLSGGKTAAFAGVSGVGKSTMMNLVFPQFSLETGEVSSRTGRGKHTTRQAEFFVIPIGEGERCFIADTPGFSMLDFERFDFMTIDDLTPCFVEFERYVGACQYADCTHTGEGENECAVKAAVRDGDIAESRYASYRQLYDVLKQKKNSDFKRSGK